MIKTRKPVVALIYIMAIICWKNKRVSRKLLSNFELITDMPKYI